VENLLDRFYYSNAIMFSQRMPKQGELFRDFLENEVHILNIKTLLKLKKAGMAHEEIENFMLFYGSRLSRQELLRLAKSDDIESAINLIGKFGYGKLLKDVYDKSKKDISPVELKLNKHLLERQILLLHQNPLSVDVILGYMFAKEIEIKNLRTIIKGRQLGLKDEFIEKQLVIWG
ncbi:MAG: V-type ATPase subunit, partial [Nanoarchaeota archaeon]|nr:V-type ATPase subunit [Nanoarchaeota archaeon]